ncbi:monoacylglycerol lipase ABHD6 [Lingula anatina]|uniref:acylglycerol lipase n=1 Tax=Lingula anatina TaxID=7574 RepID=A0A1S3HRL0_LINAN|nr:monoacylglycerol lipase ABHD6 [Lingula anatina]|eukprot:XP_013388668.1 monoacylglycerol lipase ABHD6 [Lingula anatina]
MAKVVALTSLTAVVLTAAGRLLYRRWFHTPANYVRELNRQYYKEAGVEAKRQQVGPHNFAYLEKGTPTTERPSLLFVHGFTGEKENWLFVLKRLPAERHAIAVDLLGHGDSTDYPDDPSIRNQAQTVKKFVDTVGLQKPFLIIGQSMGGAIVGNYAAMYPEDVATVTLLCPLMKTPTPSTMIADAKAGRTTALQDAFSPEAVQYMLDQCSVEKREYPRVLLEGIAELRRRHEAFFGKLYFALGKHENRTALETSLPKITVPVHVLWGDQDQIVHVSGTEVIEKVSPRSKITIIKNKGHSLNVECPQIVVDSVLDSTRGTTPKSSL